jgi:hypothetical protein
MGRRTQKGGDTHQEQLNKIAGTNPYDKVDPRLKGQIINDARVAVGNLTSSSGKKALQLGLGTAAGGVILGATGFWPLIVAVPPALGLLTVIGKDVADVNRGKQAIVDATKAVLDDLNNKSLKEQVAFIQKNSKEYYDALPSELKTPAVARLSGVATAPSTNSGVSGTVADTMKNPLLRKGTKVAPGVFTGGRKTSKIGEKFNRCVKSVRQTVRARPKSTKESAAIAICTKSVLQTRGRTMKRYRKKRLITQKKFRGGGLACA